MLVLLAGEVFAQKPGEFGDVIEDGPSVWLSVFFYILLIILVGQALAIIGKVLKVYELSTEATGDKKTIPWNTINAALFFLFLVGGMYFAIWEMIVHGRQILPEAVSEHGKTWDSMFNMTFFFTMIVFVITQILLFGFAYFYRQRKGRKALFYPHNNKLEIYWTVVPAIVLTILVIFGWVTWRNITNPDKQAQDALLVEITGEQFRWTARYPGEDGELGPKNYKLIAGVNLLGVDFNDPSSHDDFMPSEIVLPVNKPVKLLIGAKDVIHSAYIPHFRVQMNAVPGIPTTFYFTPTVTTDEMRARLGEEEFDYMLYCNKICGASHYNMAMKVVIVTEEEYAKWQAEQESFYNQNKGELQQAFAGKDEKYLVKGVNK